MEGVPAHLRGLLHPHLTLGFTATGLADLRPLGARVCVAAARKGARQPLLGRDHLEPIPYADGNNEEAEASGEECRLEMGAGEGVHFRETLSQPVLALSHSLSSPSYNG